MNMQTQIKIERASGIAVWRQIRDAIKSEVLSGTFGPGDRLPTEHEFAAGLGVNRHTVRRAVADLVDLGLLRVEQGRGTFVQEHVLDYPIGKRARFTEAVERQNRSRGRKVLDVADIRADPAIAQALGIPAGRMVVHLRSLSDVDGRRVSLSNHYFSGARFPKIAQVARRAQSVSAAFAECGVDDYFRKVTQVTTRLPTRDEATLLHQPANRPVLISEGIDVDANGKPVGFSVILWAGDRVQLTFEP